MVEPDIFPREMPIDGKTSAPTSLYYNKELFPSCQGKKKRAKLNRPTLRRKMERPPLNNDVVYGTADTP
jgi:hypothetical protein